MSIVNALQQEMVRDAAVLLAMAGVSVVPTQGKRALIPWKAYTKRAAQPNTVNRWFGGFCAADGVAIICGSVSNGLVIVDLDGLDAVAQYRRQFSYLLDTLTVSSGSGKGQHYYYRVDDVPDTARAKGFEVRSNGAYVVAPPSVHPSGRRYSVQNAAPVMQLSTLSPVLAFIESRNKKALNTKRSRQLANQGNGNGYGGYNPAWVRAAVGRELDNLRTAQPGEQNNILNAVAYRLARICANPRSGLSASNLQTDILEAANDYIQRDGLSAATRTLESGWRAGYSNPAYIPEPRQRNATG